MAQHVALMYAGQIIEVAPAAQFFAHPRHPYAQALLRALPDAGRRGEPFRAHRANARVAETWLRPGGPKLVLAKPNSFMNVSGGPVSALAAYYGIPSDRVVIVHDELDLPFDTLKLKTGGGHGGHNGVRDVAKALGSPDFTRVRVGIGRPPAGWQVVDYVLSRFTKEEQELLDAAIIRSAEAVESIVKDGMNKAMNTFNKG